MFFKGFAGGETLSESYRRCLMEWEKKKAELDSQPESGSRRLSELIADVERGTMGVFLREEFFCGGAAYQPRANWVELAFLNHVAILLAWRFR